MTGISSPTLDDTIIAVSSAPGPGRRAIVRVTGPGTREIVETVFSPDAHAPLRVAATLKTGFLRLSGVYSPLPCDLYFWKSPRTYTGQDLAELHTISSPSLVERLVADLLAAGARSAKPGEFTMRAFLSGKKDLPQAEAVLAVIEAGTDADLTAALGQLAGGVTRPLDRLRDDLLNLLADVEAGLDFVEEDIHFVSQSEILRRLAVGLEQFATLRRQLDDLEREYATTHLDRLRDNTPQSMETSALHIDLISDLKRINSHICSIAYPILMSAGALRATRIRNSQLAPLQVEDTRP